MKISGFTIARQAVALHYPLAESIRSLLPLVDEYVVGIDATDEESWTLVNAIGDPRIKPFRSEWHMASDGGAVLSRETNKALERCTGDWAMYLQADEVLHEQDLPALRRALERHQHTMVEGLSFRYYHFYGDFATIQDDPTRFYRRATRAVKTGGCVRSAGDACAFEPQGEGARRLRRADLPIRIYHYGWARPPQVMLEKSKRFDRMYRDTQWIEAHRHYPSNAQDVYAERGHLQRFAGAHPTVMRDWIAAADWRFDARLDAQPPDWLRRPPIYARWLVTAVMSRMARSASRLAVSLTR